MQLNNCADVRVRKAERPPLVGVERPTLLERLNNLPYKRLDSLDHKRLNNLAYIGRADPAAAFPSLSGHQQRPPIVLGEGRDLRGSLSLGSCDASLGRMTTPTGAAPRTGLVQSFQTFCVLRTGVSFNGYPRSGNGRSWVLSSALPRVQLQSTSLQGSRTQSSKSDEKRCLLVTGVSA